MKNFLRVSLLLFCAFYYSAQVSAQPGCPAVNAGADVNIPCGQSCTTLTASAFSAAQTTAYTVAPITYAPPFPYNAGNAILVNTDDVWSSVINLPFHFCFFGANYNNIIVGSNGVVGFNTANAGAFNNWQINGAVPANAQADLRNTIMGAWQDLDPTYQGQVFYQVSGTAPCRTFEVSWYRVPLYGDANSVSTTQCNTPHFLTQQIVIYETTNAIEVYINNKVLCTGWNGGLAVEGIVNAAGTVAYTVPGRNATQWTATNDAYRFTPAGAPNYSIAWFDGVTQIGTGNSISVCPPSSRSYTAKATYTDCDNSTVVVTDNVFVGISGLTVQTDSIHQIPCFGGTGDIYASFNSTGSAVLSYGWTPGGTPNSTSITGVTAGTYVFSVTDATNCTKYDTVTLTQPTQVVVIVPDTTITSCVGGNLGELTANVTGGTGVYTYSWNTGPTTQTLSNIGAGTYSVTVRDANNCSATANGNVIINTTTITFNPPQIIDATCTSSTGSITVSSTGGTGTVTYTWSGGLPSGATVSNLPSGTYDVTATDANGCTATASYTVNQTNPVSFGTPIIVDMLCGASGSIVVAVNGATAPITYTWSGGVSTNDTAIISVAGTYDVTATDTNGCTATASYTVNQSAGISFGTPQITDITCSTDGRIIVSVNGATAPIDFNWSGGLPNNDTVSVAVAGTYTLTATDANGCTATASYTVNQISSLVIDSANVVSVSCGGTGSITVFASGGSGTLTYTWSNGQSGSTLTVTTPGTYSVTIVDQSGCSTTGAYVISNIPCSGCPAITTTNNVTIPCGQACTTLHAAAYAGAATTSYSVSQIPYNPTSAYNVGTPILVNIDDRWSNVINLPFGFCFFGSAYNSLIVGSNGVVSFNTANANTFNSWNITGPIPSATPADLRNSIMGPWHDMDPTNQGFIYYNIIGTYPCRKFVVSWYQVPMFGDPNSVSTTHCPNPLFEVQQIVLYETTNAIQVYIQQKDACTGWNNGNAIEGIQNAAGNLAYWVPGRNATVWTAQNDAWTFLPAGPPNYVVTWFQGGNPIGTGDSIQVCPSVNTTYGVQAVYTNCNGAQVTLTDTVNVTISGGSGITIQIDSVHQVTCYNGNDGAVYASYDAQGQPVSSFGWSPGGAGQTSLTGLPPGTYIFTVTTANGCTSSDTVTLVNPAPFTVNVLDTTLNSCSGNVNNASLTATTSGGTPNFVFDWSNGQQTAIITGLSIGTYTVTVTDSLGCTATDAGSVIVNANAPTLNGAITNAVCSANNGIVIVSLNGGIEPITYAWTNNLPDNDTATGLAPGTYSVTATDVNGCSATASYTVGQTNPVSFGTPVIVPAGCGQSNGSIVVVLNGATEPITYTWTAGLPNNDTVSNLSAGTYGVTTTDANGCSATASYSVNPSSALAIDSSDVSPVTCTGLGSIAVYPSGGSGVYTYTWTGGLTGNPATGVVAGSYTVTVTDQGGCSASAYYIVGNTPCGDCPAVATNNNIDLECGETCTTLHASAVAGAQTTAYTVAPIPYNPPQPFNVGTPILVNIDDTWSNTINLPFNFCFFGTTNNQLVVGSNGVISFDVTNAGNVNSWQIPGPIPSPNPGDLTNCIMGPWHDMDPTNQGAIYYSIGGTYPCRSFTVSWYEVPMYGDPNSVSTSQCPDPLFEVQQIVLYETTNTIDVYIQQKDVCGGWNGGLAVEGIQNAAGTIAYTVPGRNATQWTAQNDAWRFAPAGAPNYVINWYQYGVFLGSGDSIQVCPDSTSTYNVDAIYTNCDNSTITVSDSVRVNVSGVLTAQVDSVINVSCFGGNNGAVYASYTSDGGTLSYGWSPGGSGTTSMTNLSAGTYVFSITNGIGCTIIDTAVVTEPNQLVVTVPDTTAYNCVAGGSITATLNTTVSGGTPGYSYSWGGGQITSSISITSVGTYNVTVTDTLGCTATDASTVSLIIASPIFNNPILTDVSCNGGNNGSIIVSTSQSTPPIVYTWSGGVSTNDTASGLAAGNYNLTAVDANGCSVSATYDINEPLPIVIDTPAVITQATCTLGGSVIVTASGGTGTLTLGWSNGDTGNTADSLAAGSYTLTVTDANGCSVTASYTITSAPGTVQLGNPVITNVSCNGGNDGSIVANASGGTGTLTYNWGNQTGDSIGGLTAGTYTLTVSDQNGCTASASYDVTQPTPIVVDSVIITQATCQNGGTITIVSVSGGAGQFTSFDWSNGDSGSSIDSLAGGPYTVTITDANGCTNSFTYTVGTAPGVIGFGTPTINNITCNGANDGSITIVITGGTPPDSIHWSTGASTATISGLSTGSYSVTITDATGCSASTTYSITEPGAITLGNPILTQATCTVGGSITVIATGGTGTLVYGWSNGQSGNSIDSLAGGPYVLTVTDANGCSVTATYTVPVAPGTVQFNAPVIVNASCAGNDGSITASASGGNGTITFNWGGGITGPVRTGLSAGTYSVTITDQDACSASTTYIVTGGSPITIDSVLATQASCAQGGTLTVVTVGGGQTPLVITWSNGDSGATADSLSAGAYTVTVTDNAGCSVSGTYNVTGAAGVIVFGNPVIANVSCNGGTNGSITVSTSGGSGVIHYQWSTSATDTFASVTSLGAGTYSVTANDNSGCSASAVYTVTEPATALTAVVTATQLMCFGDTVGSAFVTAAGGTPGYTYHWNTGSDIISVSNQPVGIVVVTVTDANNCSLSTTGFIDQASDYYTSTIVFQPNCGNIGFGTVQIGPKIIGVGVGHGPYSLTVVGVGTATVPAIDSVATFPDLASGTYAFTITDSIGCIRTGTFDVNAGVATDSLAVSTDSTTCYGEQFNDGSITVSALSSANAPYTYSFDGGLTFGTDSVWTNVAAGTYTIYTRNGFGCLDSITATVEQPAQVSVYANPDTILTAPGVSNTAVVVATNFVNPVYTWTPVEGLSAIDSPSTTITVNANSVFYVYVSESANAHCGALDSVVVIVSGVFRMPNAFTPNGDGHNDFFAPIRLGPSVSLKEFRIYNRWGELVHSAAEPWDGKLNGKEQPAGTFVYYVIASVPDEQHPGGFKDEKQEGAFSLLR